MIFKIVYWLGILAEIVIRAPFRNNLKAVKTDQRVSQTEQILLGLLTATGIVFPLIYSVTNWLDFANYGLPTWMGWLGIFVLVCALLIFWRAHADLKSNWSPSLEIFESHTLVTKGIYAYIRHPMYTSGYLVAIAQSLLLQNWIAGPLALIAFLFFHLMRVQAEEKMMLDTFGDQYREYMKRTGGVIPRLTK
jgi:protein-S-isoprenylcysteine O-methyltransferase Ste14